VYAHNGKIFFLPDILFLLVILYLDKYIYSWQTCFFGGIFLDQDRFAFGQMRYIQP